MTATRRLAAILAADVAGYSRLIGADEGGTLQVLKAGLIDPTITAYNGRLVKTPGDWLLVEFGSVVDALRCATEVEAGKGSQRTLRWREMDSNHRSPVTCELCRRGLPLLPARERERFSAISSARRPIPSSQAAIRFGRVAVCGAARPLLLLGCKTKLAKVVRGAAATASGWTFGASSFFER